MVTLELLRATGYGDGPFRVEPVSSARGGSELCSVTKFAPLYCTLPQERFVR